MTQSFWWQDAQHAVRFLGRNPVFALGVILVLAIGIGPVAALAGLMNAVFLRPWRVPDADRLAIIRARPAPVEASGTISIAEYRHLRQYSRSFSHLAAASRRSGTNSLEGGSGQQQARVRSAYMSADYFDTLKVRMALGRSFAADEEDYSAPKAVAIASHRLWQDRFGSDPAIIGRTLLIGRQAFVVVGVGPSGFFDVDRAADLWMPLPAQALVRGSPPDLTPFADPRGESLGLLAGRLNPGATRASAAAELTALSARFRSAASLPAGGIEAIDTRPVSGWAPGSLRAVLPVQALLALAVILLLVLASANAGNLLLSRAIARRREMAIRVALGASRARVVRQLLMEAAVLSMLAGTLGLGVAFAAPRLIVSLGFRYGTTGFGRITSPDTIDVSLYAPDAVVFWIAVVFVSLTALVAGLPPALQATRANLTSLSAERSSTQVGARWRMRLVTAQIAVTTVLLVGAGLLTRAIGHATSLNPGFAIKDVQVVSVKPEIPAKAMSTRGKAFFLGLRDTLQDTDLGPVAVAEEPPFWDVNLVMNARRPEETSGPIHQVSMRRVSRDYFGVLGIRIVKGRIPDSDTESREIVVNEAAARALWPGRDPIGRTVESVSRTKVEHYRVVGVAKDVPLRSMSKIEPVIYRMPDWSPVDWTVTLLVRNSPGVADRVRAVATSLEPQVIVTERPLGDYVRGSLTTAALASRVAWAIGALGLLLAIAGAFGVFTQAAEARRREIGIRMALGASRQQIAALVLRTANQALVWGLTAGFLLSVLGVPFLRRFLYGLNPFDPLAYAGVAGILMLACGVATWIPVRKAMVVDPATTLRSE